MKYKKYYIGCSYFLSSLTEMIFGSFCTGLSVLSRRYGSEVWRENEALMECNSNRI